MHILATLCTAVLTFCLVFETQTHCTSSLPDDLELLLLSFLYLCCCGFLMLILTSPSIWPATALTCNDGSTTSVACCWSSFFRALGIHHLTPDRWSAIWFLCFHQSSLLLQQELPKQSTPDRPIVHTYLVHWCNAPFNHPMQSALVVAC